MFKRIRTFITPPIVIGTAIVLALVMVGVSFALMHARPSASYVLTTTGPITGEVDSTGSVKAAESVDLSFETSGRVARVLAPVGAHVMRGQTLASLSGADFSAALAQARANLSVQQAKLDGLKAGARVEDLAVSQTAVDGAKMTLIQAKASVLSAANDAYVKADDAVHNKVDQIFTNPRSAFPILSVTFTNPQTQITAQSNRVTIESLLTSWNTFVQSQPVDASQLDVATLLATTRKNIQQVSDYLDTVASGLSTITPSAYLSTATIQGYQNAVSTGRTNLTADFSALNAAASGEQAAEAALANTQSQLQFKQAGASPTDIEAQAAQVASAEASVEAAQAQLAKTVLVAPISGTITRNDAHVGATALPNVALVSVNSDAQFQIETLVSEVDVAHIHTGDAASVRLDAYPDDAFKATVSNVDPAATIQNGIASYKVTLQFTQNDPRIQAGLTGNVHVVSQQKDNALAVPSSAIITRGTSKYVLVQSSGVDILTPVTIGISSGDGRTEIVSGIASGTRVRAFGNQ